jgi:hypothetical protein
VATDPIVIPGDLASYQGGDAQLLIDQATADVRQYCHWHVTPSKPAVTVMLDGSGNGTQILPSLHVTAITSVIYDGTLLTVDDYTWSPIGVIEYVADGPYFSEILQWATGLGKVVVVMTHGYDDAPDLAGVILALASRSQGNPNRLTRTQAGPFADQYEVGSGFTASELATLDRYRLPPRP